MLDLVDNDLVSELHSRLYAWIRTTGKVFPGGWTGCRATNRAVGFLDDLSIEYTIEGSKVWFMFLTDSQDSIDFWQIQGMPFIKEFYAIRNLSSTFSGFLNLTVGEEIPFIMMIEGLGYKYVGPLHRITRIEKK